MRFNDRSQLVGKHSFLSASKSSWVNYDDEKLERVYLSTMASQRGTDLHALAQDAIKLGVAFPDTPTTLNLYVNDCVGFRMKPEVTLFYSRNAFGTADALSFRKHKLRVFDLKTGVSPSSPRQLEVYCAYFCLEYQFRPFDIEMEMRIYQNDAIKIFEADPVDIDLIMKKIVDFDKRIEAIREENE